MQDAQILETINRMDQDLRDYDSEFGLFREDRFPSRLSEAIRTYIVRAADLGSKQPVLFFREATILHPESGLAWYGLFMAICSCDKASGDEGLAALAKAMDLGCGYIVVKDGRVLLSPLENE